MGGGTADRRHTRYWRMSGRTDPSPDPTWTATPVDPRTDPSNRRRPCVGNRLGSVSRSCGRPSRTAPTSGEDGGTTYYRGGLGRFTSREERVQHHHVRSPSVPEPVWCLSEVCLSVTPAPSSSGPFSRGHLSPGGDGGVVTGVDGGRSESQEWGVSRSGPGRSRPCVPGLSGSTGRVWCFVKETKIKKFLSCPLRGPRGEGPVGECRTW